MCMMRGGHTRRGTNKTLVNAEFPTYRQHERISSNKGRPYLEEQSQIKALLVRVEGLQDTLRKMEADKEGIPVQQSSERSESEYRSNPEKQIMRRKIRVFNSFEPPYSPEGISTGKRPGQICGTGHGRTAV